MKKFWVDFLNKLMFDTQIRADMADIVEICESTGLSGVEKRKRAFEMIEQMGIRLGGWLLELAFTLALASLKLKLGK